MHRSRIPFYTGSGWYAYTYKLHLQGSQQWFQEVQGCPRKLLITGQAHLGGSLDASTNKMPALTCDQLAQRQGGSGGTNEPPVKVSAVGANRWRYGDNRPTVRKRDGPSSHCTAGAGCGPGSLWAGRTQRPARARQLGTDAADADQRNRAAALCARPTAPEDTLLIGPLALNLYAAIDQDDANSIVHPEGRRPGRIGAVRRGRATEIAGRVCATQEIDPAAR